MPLTTAMKSNSLSCIELPVLSQWLPTPDVIYYLRYFRNGNRVCYETLMNEAGLD